MTCNNCAVCSKQKPTEQHANFEMAMKVADEAISYAMEHVDHPQYGRIKYPNRVAVAEYFLGIYEDEETGPRILVWNTDTPEAEMMIYVNGRSMGVCNPDSSDPSKVTDVLGLMNNFKVLLETHFFNG